MKNLNFKSILESAEKLEWDGNPSYIRSYTEFIKFFEKLDPGEITEHDLVIASHFVYGWMPTTLNLRLEEKEKAIELLNDVKNDRVLEGDELAVLKNAVNNSFIGLSKLLHFINPKYYVILDSRVFRYITEKKSTYGIGKPEFYLEYCEKVKLISENSGYDKVHALISRYFEYDIYPTRAIEVTMFETDRNRQNG